MWRRCLPFLGLVLVVVVACGPTSGEDACASYGDDVRWDGHLYHAASGVDARYGRDLGEGRQAGDCGGTPVRVVALDGIPPELAVGAAPRRAPRKVYVAEGFVTTVPAHPLQRELHPRPPVAESCGGPFTTSGVVEFEPSIGGHFAVRSPRGQLAVVVRERARVTGFDRLGVPYFARGDALVLSGRRCRYGSYARVLFATAIRRFR